MAYTSVQYAVKPSGLYRDAGRDLLNPCIETVEPEDIISITGSLERYRADREQTTDSKALHLGQFDILHSEVSWALQQMGDVTGSAFDMHCGSGIAELLSHYLKGAQSLRTPSETGVYWWKMRVTHSKSQPDHCWKIYR